MAKWRYTVRGLQRMGMILRTAREEKNWNLRRVELETSRYERSQYVPGEQVPPDIGISYSTINRYENGFIKKTLDPRILGLLTAVLQPLDPKSNTPYTIQQLVYIAMDMDEEERSELLDLFMQFRQLVEEEPNLKREDKDDALRQLDFLRIAGEVSQDSEERQRARSSIRMLKGLLTELPTSSALSKEGNQIIPRIAKVIGLN